METIDELRKRQLDEIGQMLDNQRKIWEDLRERHNDKIPDDVADDYRKAARLETFALEEKQVKEREAIPFYGEVLKTEREIVTEMRGIHDNIEMYVEINRKAKENEEELDEVQKTLEKLLQEARSRELNQTLKPGE